MPSPMALADVRTAVRRLISAAVQQELGPDEQSAQARELAVRHGRSAISVGLTFVLNAMSELQHLVPGAHTGGIAGDVQNNLKRFGEPYASIVMDLSEPMRLTTFGASEAADQAVLAAWRRWGPDCMEVIVMMTIVLYGHIAAARDGVGLERAWADAAKLDEQRTAEHLAAPLTIAVQGLWEAGFTARDEKAITVRLQSLMMEVAEFDDGSANFADLCTTPERTAAMRNLFDVMKAERDRKRGEAGSL